MAQYNAAQHDLIGVKTADIIGWFWIMVSRDPECLHLVGDGFERAAVTGFKPHGTLSIMKAVAQKYQSLGIALLNNHGQKRQ